MASDDETAWGRALLTGAAALVVVSLVVGGVVGAVVLSAARLSGLGQVTTTDQAAAPSLFIPSGRPTTRPQAFPDPPGGRVGGTKPSAGGQKKSTGPKAKARPLTLRIDPARARSGERIDLTGVYRRGDGAVLQVQRFEDGWTDFPVTATVRGRAYRTFIVTERAGKSRLRMFDKAAGRASNVVTLTIR